MKHLFNSDQCYLTPNLMIYCDYSQTIEKKINDSDNIFKYFFKYVVHILKKTLYTSLNFINVAL